MPDAKNVELPKDKAIVFTFEGGPRDGQESRWAMNTPPTEAIGYWMLTNRGEVGQMFAGMAPHIEVAIHNIDTSNRESIHKVYREHGGPFTAHVYRIIDRVGHANNGCVARISKSQIPFYRRVLGTLIDDMSLDKPWREGSLPAGFTPTRAIKPTFWRLIRRAFGTRRRAFTIIREHVRCHWRVQRSVLP